MSRISRFCRTLDQWCNGYGRFVNELRGGSLQFLAIVTVVSEISLFSSSKITSEADDTIYVVYVIGLLYLAAGPSLSTARDDYGFSDGFLAAAYTLLFPMCATNSLKIYLTLATFFLFRIRNLQLHTPIEIQIPPIPLHIPQAPVPPVFEKPVDQTEINMSRRGKKSAGRSTIHQPQAYKSNLRHNRHAST
ncbi:unnamed protein product [Arabidopsis halleri]